jgi:arylsulfatase A-like enzyme
LSLLRRILPLLSAAVLAGCSAAPHPEGPAPNILLIIMDAARADHFSCYGYHRPTTPNIDRLAAESLRFTQAVSTSSWTLPSHASLFTGLLPFEHGTHAQHTWLIDRIPTLAELLRMKGYRTAGYTDNPFIDESKNMTRGFDNFEPLWADSGSTSKRKIKHTDRINALARQFIKGDSASGNPFFIFINYMDVHTPYNPPEPYQSTFLGADRNVSPQIDSVNHEPHLVNKKQIVLSDSDYEVLRNLYDGSILYLDSKIEELIAYLKDKGLFENTLIIVTSDHGEVFGEYGLFTHGHYVYRPLVHIPLIIHHPGLTGPPAVRHTPVSLTDVFYTIMRLVGVEDEAAITGAQRSYLFDKELIRKSCFSELRVSRVGGTLLESQDRNARSLWTAEGMHYLLYNRQDQECYDLNTDFDEQRSLSPAEVSGDQVIAAITGYEERLNLFTETEEDLRITRESRVSPHQEAAMRALGYVGGSDQLQDMEEHPHVMEHLKTGVFFFLNDSLEAAEQQIRTAIKMSPHNLIARKYLGYIFFNRGKYKEAQRVLQTLLGKTNAETSVRLLLAECHAKLQRTDEALEMFRRISEEYPDEPKSALGAAKILMGRRDYSGAEIFLLRALEKNPDNLEILRMAIGIHLRAENLARARELLLVEVEKSPSIQVHLVLSDICKKMGLVEESREWLGKALAMDIPPALRAKAEQMLKELQSGGQ